MSFLRINRRYKNAEEFVKTCRNLVMEIEVGGGTFFVNGQTEDGCRLRADQLYGEGQWKEVVITSAKAALKGESSV